MFFKTKYRGTPLILCTGNFPTCAALGIASRSFCSVGASPMANTLKQLAGLMKNNRH